MLRLADDIGRTAAPVDAETVLPLASVPTATGALIRAQSAPGSSLRGTVQCDMRMSLRRAHCTDESMGGTMMVRGFKAPAEGAMKYSLITTSPPGRTAPAAARRLIALTRAHSASCPQSSARRSLVERLPLPRLRLRSVRQYSGARWGPSRARVVPPQASPRVRRRHPEAAGSIFECSNQTDAEFGHGRPKRQIRAHLAPQIHPTGVHNAPQALCYLL